MRSERQKLNKKFAQLTNKLTRNVALRRVSVAGVRYSATALRLVTHLVRKIERFQVHKQRKKDNSYPLFSRT